MGRKNTYAGRRGRKKREQERRAQKKREEIERARAEETAQRDKMLKTIVPWVKELCELSEVGVIVERRVEGKFPRLSWFPMYCAEGYVARATLRIDTVAIYEVHPWNTLSTTQLKRLVRRRWKPFWPKDLLQRLAEV